MKIIILLSIFVFCVSAYAAEVSKISVKGNTIKVGQTSDEARFTISKWYKYQTKYELTHSDPSNPGPGNLTSSKVYYKIGDKKFYMIISRTKDPGPFRITKIVVQ